MPDKIRTAVIAKTPLGRPGTPPDAAHLVEDDLVAALGELPGGFAAGEAAAEDVELLRIGRRGTHGWKLSVGGAAGQFGIFTEVRKL